MEQLGVIVGKGLEEHGPSDGCKSATSQGSTSGDGRWVEPCNGGVLHSQESPEKLEHLEFPMRTILLQRMVMTVAAQWEKLMMTEALKKAIGMRWLSEDERHALSVQWGQ